MARCLSISCNSAWSKATGLLHALDLENLGDPGIGVPDALCDRLIGPKPNDMDLRIDGEVGSDGDALNSIASLFFSIKIFPNGDESADSVCLTSGVVRVKGMVMIVSPMTKLGEDFFISVPYSGSLLEPVEKNAAFVVSLLEVVIEDAGGDAAVDIRRHDRLSILLC